MNDLALFNFNDNEVRVHIDGNGDPWFVASDVAATLGYRDSYNMTRVIAGEDKGTHIVRTPNGGHQSHTTVNEYGLYSAIMGSRVPAARDFKRWVTHEVLPSIRKHGAYLTDETLDTVSGDTTALTDLIATLTAERDAARNDAAIAHQITDAHGAIPIGTVAKMYGLGQNKLFKFLRNQGVLITKGSRRNAPMQQYARYFTVTGDLDVTVNGKRKRFRPVTMATPEGVVFIGHLLMRAREAGKIAAESTLF